MARRGSSNGQAGKVETAILTSAEQTFSARGYEATTVAHLLEAASVSRRTFYRYFESKEAVLVRLYEASLQTLQAALFASGAGASSSWDRMRATLSEYLRFHGANRALLKTFVLEGQRPSSPLFERRNNFRALLARLVDNAVTERRGVAPDPYVAVGLVAVLDRLSQELLEPEATQVDVARVEAVVVGFLDAAADDGGSLPRTR